MIKLPIKEKNTVMGVRIPIRIMRLLRKTAQSHKCNCADLVRIAIEDFIKKHNLDGGEK